MPIQTPVTAIMKYIALEAEQDGISPHVEIFATIIGNVNTSCTIPILGASYLMAAKLYGKLKTRVQRSPTKKIKVRLQS